MRAGVQSRLSSRVSLLQAPSAAAKVETQLLSYFSQARRLMPTVAYFYGIAIRMYCARTSASAFLRELQRR